MVIGFITDKGVEARSENWRDDPVQVTLLTECLDRLGVPSGPLLEERVRTAYATIGKRALLDQVRQVYSDTVIAHCPAMA